MRMFKTFLFLFLMGCPDPGVIKACGEACHGKVKQVTIGKCQCFESDSLETTEPF